MPSNSDTANGGPTAPHVAELKHLACEAGFAAVREAVARASTETLAAVVTSMSDPHYVLMLLVSDVPPAPAARRIAEAEARMRTAAFRALMSKQAGRLLDRQDVAALLGVSPATVGAMQRRRQILAVPFGREIRYPALQFENGKPIAGLQQLLMALGGMQPWVQLQSLLMPLEGFAPAPTSMLQLLRNGMPDEDLVQLCGLARSWAS